MKHQKLNIIGITVRTCNADGSAQKDIPSLWAKFMEGQMASKIPNKMTEDIYCIYTEYEKDHLSPYTTLLGCRVKNLDDIPEGMKGMSFVESNYEKFTAKGNIMQGIVFDAWLKIWDTSLSRTYTADFEVYGERAQNPEDAEVDIYVAVK